VLVTLLTRLSYLALFGLLVAGGLGVPVPEELIQLTAGYLARRGTLALLPAMAFSWLGLVTGDYLLFRMGRRVGPALLSVPLVVGLGWPLAGRILEVRRDLHEVELVLAAAAILTAVTWWLVRRRRGRTGSRDRPAGPGAGPTGP
jgi:membrane protein DedA with SNARE-associated domain